MISQETPVNDARFDGMAAAYPSTAAAHIPLLIWRDDVGKEEQAQVYRHDDFFSLYIVRQGRGSHVIDGVTYGVARGDVYAMGMGMTHHFADCDDLATDTFHFKPQLFDAATLDALAETPGFQSLFVDEPSRRRETNGEGGRWLHLTPDAYAEVAVSVAEIRSEWSSGTPSGTLLTRGLFVRLLVHLARYYSESGEHAARPGRAARATADVAVSAAVRYMDDHFTEPIRVEQIAGTMFLSPDRFTEVFTAAMGRTPRDYLRHLRLERAKFLLAASPAPVSAVGERSGFGEPAYFARVFRSATGMTPREYRRRSTP